MSSRLLLRRVVTIRVADFFYPTPRLSEKSLVLFIQYLSKSTLPHILGVFYAKSLATRLPISRVVTTRLEVVDISYPTPYPWCILHKVSRHWTSSKYVTRTSRIESWTFHTLLVSLMYFTPSLSPLDFPWLESIPTIYIDDSTLCGYVGQLCYPGMACFDSV